MGEALYIYRTEHKGSLAPLQSVGDMKRLLLHYDRDYIGSFEDRKTHKSFRPNTSLAGLSYNQIKDPDQTIAFYMPEPSPEGRYVVFVYGDAEPITQVQWLRLSKNSHIKTRQ